MPDHIATPEQVAAVHAALADGQWHKSNSTVFVQRGIRPVTIRQVAAETQDIIGLPQSGYRLAAAATQEELHHARSSLLSRAQKIINRALALEAFILDEIDQGELF